MHWSTISIIITLILAIVLTGCNDSKETMYGSAYYPSGDANSFNLASCAAGDIDACEALERVR